MVLFHGYTQQNIARISPWPGGLPIGTVENRMPEIAKGNAGKEGTVHPKIDCEPENARWG